MFGDHHSSKAERYCIDVTGPDAEAERLLFAHAIRWAIEHKASTVTVVVATLDNIRNLDRVLGGRGAAALAKSRKVNVGDGVTLSVVTTRTMRSAYSITGPVVVPWASDRMMREVDAMHSPAIFAKPWIDTDLVEWKANWSPVDPRTGEAGSDRVTISDPVVEQAMISVSECVNLNYPFGHDYDQARIVQTLKALRDHGHEADPAEVRAWAINNRWSPDHAKELEETARKVQERRPIRNGDRVLDARKAIKGWRERAEHSAAADREA